MIAVQKWGIFVAEEGQGHHPDTESYEHKVWREGVLVTYDDGFFLLESFQDDVKLYLIFSIQ